MPGSAAPQIEEILLLHHSHLDVGYTHTQPIVWELQREFIEQVIEWLEDTADHPGGSRPAWTCEVTEPVRRWLAGASAREIDRFKSLVVQGRIGLAALRWHITANVDQGGLRRLVASKYELEERLETRIRVACQHDVNGVPWPLADVLIDADVDLFVMATNPHLGKALQPRPRMFNWEAPSGRTIRVFNGLAYTMFDQLLNAWDDSTERMQAGWLELDRRLAETEYPYPFLFLTSTCSPVLWDNGPPNPFLPPLIEKWNNEAAGPPIRYGTFDDLRERALAVPDSALPRLRGDWTDYWSFGIGSTPNATRLSRRGKLLLEAATTITAGRPHRSALAAADHLDLFDEHTFGHWDTRGDHPQTQTTELLKQALAHEGYELAGFALMDGLERLSKNPAADRDIRAVLVCNPGPEKLTMRPSLPDSWCTEQPPALSRSYRASRMAYDGRAWEGTFPGRQSTSFGPVELDPYSWRAIPIDALPPTAPAADLTHTVEAVADIPDGGGFVVVAGDFQPRIGTIASAAFELRYDPDTGRILSLRDRPNNRELLAPRAGLDLFSFVRERTDGLDEERRYAFYRRDLDRERVDQSCWHHWAPVHEPATRTLSCEISTTHDRITMKRTAEAPGTRSLIQRFTLLTGDPVLRVEVDLELEPDASPQSIYFATSLRSAAGWRAFYDTAGVAVELDRDQLPGACRNWVTAQTFAAIGGEGGAVALLCPDAPLIQFGDFAFGPPVESVRRDMNPLLLAWAVNNYWDTNFPRSPGGRIRLSYGLCATDRLDATLINEIARPFIQPPILWPITGSADVAQASGLFEPQAVRSTNQSSL